MGHKPLDSLVIKPAGPDCNLACSYCFYTDKVGLYPGSSQHRMSLQLLEVLIRRTMEESGPAISYGWQGGEPTLIGLPFFEKAVSYQSRYGAGKTVDNSLQTNGILLSSQWAEFLANYNFLVGLSLDGPEPIHDMYRRRSGKKSTTHGAVRPKVDLLLKHGVELNALCCVTDHSVRFPQEIYEYFKSIGIQWMQFIPVLEQDLHGLSPFSVDADSYGEFLCRLWDLWLGDFRDSASTTSIRWFESVFYTYVGKEAPDCTLRAECGNYLVVEHNGDVYACDFHVEPKWKLGNISEASPIRMLTSGKQEEFGRRKAELPVKCTRCDFKIHCFGGCPKDRLLTRHPGEPGLCRAYETFFEHADGDLRNLARAWRDRR